MASLRDANGVQSLVRTFPRLARVLGRSSAQQRVDAKSLHLPDGVLLALAATTLVMLHLTLAAIAVPKQIPNRLATSSSWAVPLHEAVLDRLPPCDHVWRQGPTLDPDGLALRTGLLFHPVENPRASQVQCGVDQSCDGATSQIRCYLMTCVCSVNSASDVPVLPTNCTGCRALRWHSIRALRWSSGMAWRARAARIARESKAKCALGLQGCRQAICQRHDALQRENNLDDVERGE